MAAHTFWAVRDLYPINYPLVEGEWVPFGTGETLEGILRTLTVLTSKGLVPPGCGIRSANAWQCPCERETKERTNLAKQFAPTTADRRLLGT